MKNIIVLFFLGALIFTSCEKEYEPENTATVDFAGQWWTHYNVDGEDFFGAGYRVLDTYNTAADDGKEIWITDESTFWDYKVKCPVNLSNLTFGSTDTLLSAVVDYEIKIVISNGKIIKNGGTTLGGRTVDSIYFEIWFEDFPDVTFEACGVAHTGFSEDDPYQ